ncbi:CSLREA domain-containing protein [Acinetobacter sp. YH16031]|uniref:CSLREA domain-containing protein n=1 Tax=Acinetobacter sp. YH16031 TaxID=2601180 RepID=UPI0015D18EFD|nr:CSLREA domain-containing protein [Acinetobacter sp. YH16031]
MKNYKKGLLAAMILSAMSLMAAEDKTIYVTTFADEDGENTSACSLREAIKTAKLDKSYGGCNVGRTLRNDGSAPDVIQLEAGEYKLNSEIIVESHVNILGKSPFNYTQRSPITFLYPIREALITTISGQGKTRLFNTVASQASMVVNGVILKDGYAAKTSLDKGNGGTFYVAGPLSLVNSEIVNSRAAAEGGAIYAVAMNNEKIIKIQDSLIHQNKAATYGSVLAMDCVGNLGSTETKLEISASSIVKNGSTDTASILDFCGYAKADISNSTIAKNTTNATGHIFRMANEISRPLSSFFTFSAINNTIVENTARSTIFYDNTGNSSLAYNVLAFNQGLSCEYALNGGNPSKEQGVDLFTAYNAIHTSGSSRCVLPELAENSVSTNIDVSNNKITDLLTTYIEPSVNNRYLGMYYPIDRQSNTDLVNIGTESCEEIDQRGIERLTKATLLFNPDAKNSCEIGSIEIRNLTAADISGLKNSSLTELLDYYQENIDDINSILADKNTKPEEIQGLKEELKEYEDLLKYTKQYQKYRAIYVNPFSLVMPQETLNNTQVQAKALNSQNYEITVQSLGVGSLSGSGSSLIVQGAPNDPNLKCEWKPDLNRIMMYRTDGKVTSLSDTEYCRYTIKDKQTGASSTGILQGAFVNIKPIVKNDEYRISAENNLTVTVNPLENDSDDGDGPRMNGKAAFYRDKDGREIPIRIVKLPAGVNLSAEREGPCPGNFAGETCYGGKLTFSVKNTFSQSDYDMQYHVFDADELMSDTARINLKNTAKNTNTSSSGGGSFGIWGLFGLLGLAGYRRIRK